MGSEPTHAFRSSRFAVDVLPNASLPPPRRPLALGLIGPGRVGSALLTQLDMARQRLLRSNGLDIQLRGIATSKAMWFDESDALPRWMRDEGGCPVDLDEFGRRIRASTHPGVLIDCTASDEVAGRYATWMHDGLHIVTPNKRMGSGSWDRWQELCRAGANVQFRHETTVCAGLPVVQTLKDLINTGDELVSIEGMFSGTLAWLFHHHDGTRPFSALLRTARELGYTEPDPRQDLSGADVARKLVILAREAGMRLSHDEVSVEDLVPEPLRSVTVDAFMRGMEDWDSHMAAKLRSAHAAGGVLRHVGRLSAEGATASVCVVPRNHPFAQTHATDNIVQIVTRRYRDNPMQIRGPGAGPEVTAGGIFADLLRVAETV